MHSTALDQLRVWGRCKPPAGSGAKLLQMTHFLSQNSRILTDINLESDSIVSGLFRSEANLFRIHEVVSLFSNKVRRTDKGLIRNSPDELQVSSVSVECNDELQFNHEQLLMIESVLKLQVNFPNTEAL